MTLLMVSQTPRVDISGGRRKFISVLHPLIGLGVIPWTRCATQFPDVLNSGIGNSPSFERLVPFFNSAAYMESLTDCF